VEISKWQQLLIAFNNWIGVERAGQFQGIFTVLKIGPSRQARFQHLRVKPLHVHLSDGADQSRVENRPDVSRMSDS
jgi:hypothetical protein